MAVLCVDQRAQALGKEVCRLRRVIGVEIGVYTGQLSRRLLAMNPDLFLYMVDPWAPTGAAAYRQTGDYIAEMTQEQHDDAMQTALAAVRPYWDRIRVLRKLSVDAAHDFQDGWLDFAFIDGDHSYEGVRDDIAAWWPKIRQGGVLSGHDYRDDKAYGVKQAVHEWLGDKHLRLGENMTWFVSKNGS